MVTLALTRSYVERFPSQFAAVTIRKNFKVVSLLGCRWILWRIYVCQRATKVLETQSRPDKLQKFFFFIKIFFVAIEVSISKPLYIYIDNFKMDPGSLQTWFISLYWADWKWFGWLVIHPASIGPRQFLFHFSDFAAVLVKKLPVLHVCIFDEFLHRNKCHQRIFISLTFCVLWSSSESN